MRYSLDGLSDKTKRQSSHKKLVFSLIGIVGAGVFCLAVWVFSRYWWALSGRWSSFHLGLPAELRLLAQRLVFYSGSTVAGANQLFWWNFVTKRARRVWSAFPQVPIVKSYKRPVHLSQSCQSICGQSMRLLEKCIRNGSTKISSTERPASVESEHFID